jgi:hypothetical protein
VTRSTSNNPTDFARRPPTHVSPASARTTPVRLPRIAARAAVGAIIRAWCFGVWVCDFEHGCSLAGGLPECQDSPAECNRKPTTNGVAH